MATSRIEITFNDDLSIGDQVYFEKRFNDGVLDTGWQPVQETWVNFRSGANQVTQGTPTAIQGERSAINFVQAINLDYLFTYPVNGELVNGVERIGNKVIIRQHINWSFRLIDPDPTSADVSISIFNWSGINFNITGATIGTATTNPVCTHFKIFFSFNTDIVKYKIGSNDEVILGGPSDSIELEFLRGQGFTAQFYDADDNLSYYSLTSFQVPSILNVNSLNIQVNATPNGGTATASIITTLLTLEYSLDDNTWYDSEVFNNLPEGDYTMYVRDHLGCKISKAFHVDEFGVGVPYFHIPKANPIRFANVVTWGDCSNYKTDDNTLSCQENVRKAIPYTQLFQSCDIIPTQIHSNYNVNSMKIVDEDDNETVVNFIQKSNFMQRKDMRDARMYSFDENKTGIYFLTGNIYDYDTQADTGNDHSLNGTLPEWGVVGNYVRLNNTWYVVDSVQYDPEKNADVLLISNIYTGADQVVQVASIYNLENFEVFESEIDFVSFIDKKLRVYIDAQDSNFVDLAFVSELIWVKVSHENTSMIRYKNSTNTDVYFNTGIEFKIRFEVEDIYAKDDEETEISISDTQAKIYKANIYEKNTYVFSPVPTEMMRKLKQILVHDILEIDNTPYAKNDAPEVTNLEGTNLYDVVANMVKSGRNFNSNASLGEIEFNGSNEEVPGLVDFGGGFVKY